MRYWYWIGLSVRFYIVETFLISLLILILLWISCMRTSRCDAWCDDVLAGVDDDNLFTIFKTRFSLNITVVYYACMCWLIDGEDEWQIDGCDCCWSCVSKRICFFFLVRFHKIIFIQSTPSNPNECLTVNLPECSPLRILAVIDVVQPTHWTFAHFDSILDIRLFSAILLQNDFDRLKFLRWSYGPKCSGRGLLRMAFDVFGQMIAAHKWFRTNLAYESLFAGVRAFVAGQFIGTRKPAFAILPFANEWSFAGVNALMGL